MNFAFPAAVKRLSQVRMCNSQRECISKLVSSAYGSISVSFHRSMAARLAMSMKTALPVDGLEISRTFRVWGSDVILQTEKLYIVNKPLVRK